MNTPMFVVLIALEDDLMFFVSFIVIMYGNG